MDINLTVPGLQGHNPYSARLTETETLLCKAYRDLILTVLGLLGLKPYSARLTWT